MPTPYPKHIISSPIRGTFSLIRYEPYVKHSLKFLYSPDPIIALGLDDVCAMTWVSARVTLTLYRSWQKPSTSKHQLYCRRSCKSLDAQAAGFDR